MFCGNCGKEIEDGALFCPDCGTKTNNIPTNSVTYTKPKISFKKIRNIAISLLLVFAIVFSAVKIVDFIKSIPSDEEIRLASNNSINDTLATTDGKWLYYFGDGNEGIYREKLSNGKQKKVILPGENSGELFCIGNKLYAESLSYVSVISTSGKKLYEIPNTDFCEKKFKTDGKKCYFDSFPSNEVKGVSSQKLNGKNAKSISDISVSHILFYDDYLYLLSPYGKVGNQINEHQGVTRMKTDGSDAELILDSCPDYFVFSEKKIYYTEDD